MTAKAEKLELLRHKYLKTLKDRERTTLREVIMELQRLKNYGDSVILSYKIIQKWNREHEV